MNRKNSKRCSKCGTIKSLDSYYTYKGRGKSNSSICKECQKKTRKEWYAKNKVDALNKQKLYEATPKARLASLKAQVNRHYGISLEDVSIMMDKQRGCCAVCKDSLVYPDSWRRYDIDHSHKTGKVRGLLCSNCNKGIGLLADSIEILSCAIDYLKGN